MGDFVDVYILRRRGRVIARRAGVCAESVLLEWSRELLSCGDEIVCVSPPRAVLWSFDGNQEAWVRTQPSPSALAQQALNTAVMPVQSATATMRTSARPGVRRASLTERARRDGANPQRSAATGRLR